MDHCGSPDDDHARWSTGEARRSAPRPKGCRSSGSIVRCGRPMPPTPTRSFIVAGPNHMSHRRQPFDCGGSSTPARASRGRSCIAATISPCRSSRTPPSVPATSTGMPCSYSASTVASSVAAASKRCAYPGRHPVSRRSSSSASSRLEASRSVVAGRRRPRRWRRRSRCGARSTDRAASSWRRSPPTVRPPTVIRCLPARAASSMPSSSAMPTVGSWDAADPRWWQSRRTDRRRMSDRRSPNRWTHDQSRRHPSTHATTGGDVGRSTRDRRRRRRPLPRNEAPGSVVGPEATRGRRGRSRPVGDRVGRVAR